MSKYINYLEFGRVTEGPTGYLDVRFKHHPEILVGFLPNRLISTDWHHQRVRFRTGQPGEHGEMSVMEYELLRLATEKATNSAPPITSHDQFVEIDAAIYIFGQAAQPYWFVPKWKMVYQIPTTPEYRPPVIRIQAVPGFLDPICGKYIPAPVIRTQAVPGFFDPMCGKLMPVIIR